MIKWLVLILIFGLSANGQDNAPNLNTVTDPAINQAVQDDEIDFILGQRDPFSPPKYIRDLEYEKTKEQGRKIRPEDVIDDQMEAIRRWPLNEYRLLAVIWDVRSPKAMVMDKSNTMHLLKKNYRIGNREGVISEINESEIIVLQNGVPVVLQISRSVDSKNKVNIK